jgi:hypothetical protein
VATGVGTAMDITAFQELIAQARESAAALAEAERKVAAFKAELAQQNEEARLETGSAPSKPIQLAPKRLNSGWVPADKPILSKAS